jgi:hypothetical protein
MDKISNQWYTEVCAAGITGILLIPTTVARQINEWCETVSGPAQEVFFRLLADRWEGTLDELFETSVLLTEEIGLDD